MNTYDRTEFGKRLQSAIDRAGISQGAAGRIVGVEQSTVSQWCRGVSDITVSKATELARGLGVSLDWLVGLSEERNEVPSASEKAILELAAMIRELGVEGLVERAKTAISPNEKTAAPSSDSMDSFYRAIGQKRPERTRRKKAQ